MKPTDHPSPAIQRLFVYGTLAPGRSNSHLLEAIGGAWCRARVRGTLCSKGWGASLGYPAIVLDERGGEIDGFLFSSERLSDHWARLDAFEGDAYERVLATIRLGDDSRVDAYVYAWKG